MTYYTNLAVDLIANHGSDFTSSSVDIVGYDRASKTLYIEFHNSVSVYGYEGVEESTYNLLVSAPSVGRFYRDHIQGEYTSTKYDGFHVINQREEAEPEVEVDDEYLTSNSTIFSGTGLASILTVPSPTRYSVKWENIEGTIGGHPEYQAMSEQDALAQCRAAIEAAGIDGYKIVSVTHYFA